MSVRETLRECAVFQRLTDEQMKEVESLSVEDVYESGSTMFRAGDSAAQVFVIAEGKVALQMELPEKATNLHKRVSVDVISKGELCGWSGIVEPHVHTLTGVCLQPTNVVAIDASKLSALMDRDCTLAREVLYGLIGVVASRLRDTMQLLVSERSLV